MGSINWITRDPVHFPFGEFGACSRKRPLAIAVCGPIAAPALPNFRRSASLREAASAGNGLGRLKIGEDALAASAGLLSAETASTKTKSCYRTARADAWCETAGAQSLRGSSQKLYQRV
jgi:hypothetical protein